MRLNRYLDDWTVKAKGEDAEKRKAFGSKLRKYRQENEISIDEFARRAHLSGECLVRIENGYVALDNPGIMKKIQRAKDSELMVIA